MERQDGITESNQGDDVYELAKSSMSLIAGEVLHRLCIVKEIAIIFFIFILTPVYGEYLFEGDSDFIRNFENECKYFLGYEIINPIISQESENTITHNTEYKIYRYYINIELEKISTEAKLEFSCSSTAINISTKTPEQIIKEEDAGGRYFRHIAWQREIHGNNWQGIIAYSDYLFGDSEKIPTYDYLICPKHSQCFSYSINVNPKLKAHERESALDILKTIRYLE